MNGRKYQVSANTSYKYGQNGQEQDRELNENIYTAEYWQYDARLGRRWNVDPLTKYWQSGYACFNNNPIVFADPTGLDGVPKQHTAEKKDTYSSLSKKYGVTVDDLRKWNKYGDKNIPIGATLNVSNPDKDLNIGGSDQKAASGEDFISSTDAVFKPAFNNGIYYGINEEKRWDNSKLIEELEDALTDGTFGEQDEDAKRLVKHLATNSGSDFRWSKSTGELMMTTTTFADFEKDLKQKFRAQMVLHKGNYSNIIVKVNTLPNFTGDESPSLKALIGGTQQLDIWLTNITFGNNSYKAEVTIDLFDDFGVSQKDITDPSPLAHLGLEGLKCLWILNKQRGYSTFRTVCTFKMEINGSY